MDTPSRRSLLLWVAALSVTGALLVRRAHDVDAARDATRVAQTERAPLTYYAAGCREFWLPQGFEFDWRWLNHRLSHLKLRPAQRPTCAPGLLEAGLIGGSFSTGVFFEDTPSVRVEYLPVMAEPDAPLAASRVTLSATVGPSGAVRARHVLSRERLRLQPFTHLVAAVEGLSFWTGARQPAAYPTNYDPRQGYTIRGIGARAQVVAVEPDQLELEATLRFETGDAPDMRRQMNRARRHARVQAHLDILIIGLRDTPVHRAQVSHRAAATHEGRPFDLTLRGTPNAPKGFAMLNGWDLQMRFAQEPQLGGYLRSIRVGIQPGRYAPRRGRRAFAVVGHASNQSTATGASVMRYQFDAWLTWVQATGVHDQAVSAARRFETGGTTLQLAAP